MFAQIKTFIEENAVAVVGATSAVAIGTGIFAYRQHRQLKSLNAQLGGVQAVKATVKDAADAVKDAAKSTVEEAVSAAANAS